MSSQPLLGMSSSFDMEPWYIIVYLIQVCVLYVIYSILSLYCLVYGPLGNRSGAWFNIKKPSYQYRKSHCGDKTVWRPSYLHNRISYTGKMPSLHWSRALGAKRWTRTTIMGPSHQIICPDFNTCQGTRTVAFALDVGWHASLQEFDSCIARWSENIIL